MENFFGSYYSPITSVRYRCASPVTHQSLEMAPFSRERSRVNNVFRNRFCCNRHKLSEMCIITLVIIIIYHILYYCYCLCKYYVNILSFFICSSKRLLYFVIFFSSFENMLKWNCYTE